MKNVSLRLLLMSFLVTGIFGSCGSSSVLSAGSSLMSAMGSNPSLSTMTNLLKTPGLGNMLGSVIKGPFTLLAPTNNAFSSMGTDAVNNLTKPENTSQLASMLKNYIVPGKQDAASLAKGGVSSASGNPLNLSGVNLGSIISGGKDANIIPIDKLLH